MFLLGDSISYGISALTPDESESISGYLQRIHPDYFVMNLSSCGSKPLDYYLWIRYLSKQDSNPENTYIVQYNYKWFAVDNGNIEDRVSQQRVLDHFWNYLDEDLKERLSISFSFFGQMRDYISEKIPVSAEKTQLFALFFHAKSKEDVIRNLFY